MTERPKKAQPRTNWRKRESEALAELPALIPGTPAYQALDELGLLAESKGKAEPRSHTGTEASAFEHLERANRAIINGYARRNSNRRRDKHASAGIELLIRVHGETAIRSGSLSREKLEQYADDLERAAIPTGSADGWLPTSVRSLIRRWRAKRV